MYSLHSRTSAGTPFSQARETQPKSKFCYSQILPSTGQALGEHSKGARPQTKLRSFADQIKPPIVGIRDFGRGIKDGVPVQRTGVLVSEVVLLELMKVAARGRSAHNAGPRHNRSCHSAGLPYSTCTSFSFCLAEERCYIPHTKQDNDSGNETEDRDDE